MKSGIATIVKKPKKQQSVNMTSPLELANQTEINYGMIPGTLTASYFRSSNQAEIKTMYHVMSTSRPKLYEWSSRAGIARVRQQNGKYAFFMESIIAEHLVNERPCDTTVLPEYLNPSYYAFAVAKHSPLKPLLDKAITTLIKNGVVSRLKNKWWKGKCGTLFSEGIQIRDDSSSQKHRHDGNVKLNHRTDSRAADNTDVTTENFHETHRLFYTNAQNLVCINMHLLIVTITTLWISI